MQLVEFKTVEHKAVLNNGKAELVTENKVVKTLVASTKSLNNFRDSLTDSGVIVQGHTVKDFFVQPAKAKALAETLATESGIPQDYKDAFVAHIINALNGACVIDRK